MNFFPPGPLFPWFYTYILYNKLFFSHLDLPLTSDHKKVAVSETWQIIIHHGNELSDPLNDWQANDQSNIIVTPQSLLSVVRVDSYFNPRLIPCVQASLKMEKINLNLHNHLRHITNKIPVGVIKSFPLDQIVASLVLNAGFVGLDAWAHEGNLKEVNVRLKSQIQMTFVDTHLLARHHFLLPCKLQAQAHVVRGSCGGLQIENQVHSPRIALRYGHFANDVLKNTMSLWQSVLVPGHSEGLFFNHRLTTFLIQNGSQSGIRVGQADTEETVLLKPSTELLYAWRSHKTRLMLRCSVESKVQPGTWKWTEPFSIREGVVSARINHGAYITTLCVTVKRTSTTRFVIMINGLVSTSSLLQDSLEVRLILKPNFGFIVSTDGKEDVRSVMRGASVSNSHIIQPDYISAIKVRLSGIGTPWSGDIPLEVDSTRRSSVLVRIPNKDKGKCYTVWCRLLQETLEGGGGGAKRSLFIFSPMYMARSLLPNPLRVLMNPNGNTSVTTEMTLHGQDVPTPLENHESADTKYNLSFQVADNLPPSEPFLLSWGIIEQVRDKNYKVPSIDSVREDISSFMIGKPDHHIKWPFTDNGLVLSDSGNEQPKTEVQVSDI